MIVFKITTTGFAAASKSKVNQLTKATFQNIGEFWHARFSAKHFTRAGAREYGYAKRQGEGVQKGFGSTYTGRKLRVKGHTLPLVFSGKSRDLAKRRNVRPTSKRVKIIINAPALNLRHKKGLINMRREMMTVSDGEERLIVRRFENVLLEKLNNVKAKKTKRIGRKSA